MVIQGYEGGYKVSREKSYNQRNVENKLHWQLNFTFKCDNNTTVDKKALLNLQILKKNALNILRLVKDEYKLSLQKIRFMSIQKQRYRECYI